MRWVIRHKPTSKYISSKRVLVYSQEFARRFNSRKQARRYLCASDYDKTEFTLVGYYMDKSFAPRRLTADEIKERVMQIMLERKIEYLKKQQALIDDET